MSSITAVPLQPISKGSIGRLWFGVVIVLLAAAGLAWAGTRSFQPVGFEVVQEGTGQSPGKSDVVLISYVGKLADGTVFDQNEQAAMPVDGVVPGFSEGLQKMKKGGSYKLTIPPSQGYGAAARGPIPANSTLYFDVKLIDFRSQAEIEAMQRELQQMGGMLGLPDGAAPPPAEAVPGEAAE